MICLSRRRVLATVGALSTGALAGCSGSSDSSNDASAEEELLSPDKATLTEFGEGVSGRLRSVRHNPEEQMAVVEGAVSVPTEAEYRVRLAVIDRDGVILAQEVFESLLYPGKADELVMAELSPQDCEACYSGLLEVRLTDQERAERQEAAQEERERQQEREAQQQNETNATEAGQ